MESGISSVHFNTELTWRGGEQQTLSLVQGLIRRGHPALLAASPRSELFSRAKALGLNPAGIHVFNEVDLRAIFRLVRLLKKNRPSILHLHTSHAHLIGILAATLAPPVKRIVSRRVDFSIYRHWFLGLNWIKYLYGVDRFITVSGAIRELLMGEGIPGERISVVRSGVDLSRFEPPPPADTEGLLSELGLPPGIPIIASMGALAEHKGHRYLIEAAPGVLRHLEAAFIIVGAGSRRKALERLVDSLGVSRLFRFMGFQRDIARILASASVFVFPSLQEGLGTSLLEALLLEKPVVASRVGGIPEVIESGEHGLLVPPRDPAALADSILEILRNPEAARALALRGRKRVQKEFSADRMVEGTLEVYREVLGRP